jgi:hypothetical protein
MMLARRRELPGIALEKLRVLGDAVPRGAAHALQSRSRRRANRSVEARSGWTTALRKDKVATLPRGELVALAMHLVNAAPEQLPRLLRACSARRLNDVLLAHTHSHTPGASAEVRRPR